MSGLTIQQEQPFRRVGTRVLLSAKMRGLESFSIPRLHSFTVSPNHTLAYLAFRILNERFHWRSCCPTAVDTLSAGTTFDDPVLLRPEPYFPWKSLRAEQRMWPGAVWNDRRDPQLPSPLLEPASRYLRRTPDRALRWPTFR